jgi:hypothetical protein
MRRGRGRYSKAFLAEYEHSMTQINLCMETGRACYLCLRCSTSPRPNPRCTTMVLFRRDITLEWSKENIINVCCAVAQDALKAKFHRPRHAFGKVLPRICVQCSKKSEIGEPFPSCGGCRLVVYCSKECQKKHWSASHQESCPRTMTNKKSAKKS